MATFDAAEQKQKTPISKMPHETICKTHHLAQWPVSRSLHRNLYSLAIPSQLHLANQWTNHPATTIEAIFAFLFHLVERSRPNLFILSNH